MAARIQHVQVVPIQDPAANFAAHVADVRHPRGWTGQPVPLGSHDCVVGTSVEERYILGDVQCSGIRQAAELIFGAIKNKNGGPKLFCGSYGLGGPHSGVGVCGSPFADKIHGDHPELLGRPSLEEENRILRRHTQDASGERLGLAEHLIKDFTSMGVFEAADAGAVQVQHVLCHHGPDFVREAGGASGVVSCGSFHL